MQPQPAPSDAQAVLERRRANRPLPAPDPASDAYQVLQRRRLPQGIPGERVHPDIDPKVAPGIGYDVPPNEAALPENPLLHVDRPPTVYERLQARDVLPRPTDPAQQEALSQGRAAAGFALNDQEAMNAITGPLQDATGMPVEVRDFEGNLEYRVQDGQWTRVDEPGLSVNDIRDLYGDALILGGELAGAGVGSLAANPVWTGVGAAGGAALSEAARLLIGKYKYGINQGLTEEQIATEALKAAGLSAAGSTVGFLMAKAVKGMANMIKGRGPVAGEKQIMEMAEQTEEIEKRVNELTPEGTEPFRLTVAQRTQDPELLSMQKRAESMPSQGHVGQYQDVAERQYGAIDAAQQQAMEAQGPQVAPEQAGRAAQQALRQREAEILEPRRERVVDLQRELQGAERTVASQRAPTSTVAAPTKKVAAAEQQRLRERGDELYGEIDRLSEGKKIKVPEFRAAGEKLKEEVDESVFEDVSPLLARAAGKAKPVTEIPKDIARRKGLTAKQKRQMAQDRADAKVAREPLTMGQTSRAISYLREEIRKYRKGMATEASIGDMKYLLKALLADRKAFLDKRGNKELRAAIANAEIEYRALKDRVDRSVLADLVEVDNGRPVIADENIFNEVFKPNNITPAREMASILVDHPEALQAWKAAIRDRYKKTVMDAPNRAEAHRRFMDDEEYGGVVRQFFDRKELQQIERVGGLMEVVEQAERQYQTLARRLEKTFGGKLKSMKPSDVAATVYKRTEDIAEFKRLMRDDPEALKMVKGALLRDMDSKVRPYTSELTEEIPRIGPPVPGYRPISGTKLSQYIQKNGDAMAEMFGKGFVSDLTDLAAALRFMQSGRAYGNPSGTVNALYDLTRAYVGIFTTPGRVVTAYRKIRGAMVDRVLGEALTDMDKFRTLMELRKLKPGTKKAAQVVGSLLAGYSRTVDPKQDQNVGEMMQMYLDLMSEDQEENGGTDQRRN